jgi:hypothetical protein
MPVIRFTGRAKNRLRLYHPREEDVADARAHAGRFVNDSPDRHHAWRQRTDRWLRVTFVEDPRSVKIVTVTMFENGPSDE